MVGLATVFGAGGGTSSYEEVEHTDLVLLWGSNARETHPIFFHHLLKGKRRGARMYAIDPRRTTSAPARAVPGSASGSDPGVARSTPTTDGRECPRSGPGVHGLVGVHVVPVADRLLAQGVHALELALPVEARLVENPFERDAERLGCCPVRKISSTSVR